MDDILKPCPFCGEDPNLVSVTHYGFLNNEKRKMYFVKCYWCGSASDYFEKEATARDAWNQRVEEKYNVKSQNDRS